VREKFKSGNLKGLHWSEVQLPDGSGNRWNYAPRWNRRGLSKNPLRSKETGAIAPLNQAANTNSYGCNPWGSGPGVNQSARLGGHFGLNLGNRHVGYKGFIDGVPNQATHCINKPSYTINPNSRVFSKRTSKHNAANTNLTELLAARGVPGYTADRLYAEYNDWQRNPAAYGTNPAFMTAAGFNRNAARNAGLDPRDVNAAFRQQKSNAALAQLPMGPSGVGGKRGPAIQPPSPTTFKAPTARRARTTGAIPGFPTGGAGTMVPFQPQLGAGPIFAGQR